MFTIVFGLLLCFVVFINRDILMNLIDPVVASFLIKDWNSFFSKLNNAMIIVWPMVYISILFIDLAVRQITKIKLKRKV